MKTNNLRVINPTFYTEDNALVPSISFEVSDFTAKSNNAELVAKTIFTAEDSKKNKKTAIVKTITPMDVFSDDTSDVIYTHTNKYIEKYKTINTTLAVAESGDDVYVIVAIPFNGNIDEMTTEGNSSEIVSAHYISTNAVKFSENDRLLYGKICYLGIKATPTDGKFDPLYIKFTTISSKWNADKTSCTQTARNIVMTIPAEFITNTDPDDFMFVCPEVSSTNVYNAPLAADGKLANNTKRFDSLFKIPIDKTVRNTTSNDRPNNGKKNNHFKKKRNDNDIVTNFFSSGNAYNDTHMSKKFKEAKKRYSEYDDE